MRQGPYRAPVLSGLAAVGIDQAFGSLCHLVAWAFDPATFGPRVNTAFGLKGISPMKIRHPLAIAVIIIGATLAYGRTLPIPESLVNSAFAGRRGAFVIIDCLSGASSAFRPEASSEKLAPCSTFKIWNTLIGLESGILSTAEEAFYRWDGVIRPISEWNRNLTLKEAFRASCVPAFQHLARQIGPRRMQSWINQIGYGDRDLSAGIDVFWLPAVGRKTILISPKEQAELIGKLVSGNLPFSAKSLAVLKDIMLIKRTDHGVLYGKTGSGADDNGTYALGWFVGYVENQGRTYAFACAVKGNVMGKDAREIVERVLEKQGFL
jgi:beta-lactamase class D